MTLILTAEQLESRIESAVLKALNMHDTNRSKRHAPEHCYNFNQTSKILGKSFTTVKRMAAEGRLKTVSDGKSITRAEIDRYINSL